MLIISDFVTFFELNFTGNIFITYDISIIIFGDISGFKIYLCKKLFIYSTSNNSVAIAIWSVSCFD